ncbi:hypothetical protein [Amycolatopsis sp. RTGN1]|uniref:hypothetical protein n=1 Tax=Amycolatopsis ponsaeliensis TaxID=2992142 RepID=UPI00254E97C0|nr:hypothetical protein [Amycolatopsis sp. RTGN1]
MTPSSGLPGGPAGDTYASPQGQTISNGVLDPNIVDRLTEVGAEQWLYNGVSQEQWQLLPS